MKYALPLFLFIALVTLFTPNFSSDVAAKCKGEAYWAIRDCACTVWNRIEQGIDEDLVLGGYFADPIPATPSEVARVHALIVLGCPEPYYFMFSLQDVHKLGIHNITPLKIAPSPISGTTYQVWFYEKGYRNRNGGS